MELGYAYTSKTPAARAAFRNCSSSVASGRLILMAISR